MENGRLAYRPFAEEDAKFISRFPQSAEELFFLFPKALFPLDPEQLMEQTRRQPCPTVALWKDAVVGYINFIEVRKKRFCTIGNLVVDPAHRRKGVGARLIQFMMRKSVEQFGARFVHASCFSHNTPAYQLCAKLGFIPADMALRPATDGEMVLLVNLHRRAES